MVCNLVTGEPLWFGKERKETLDDFFRSQLVSRQRNRIEAVCVDMWEPFRMLTVKRLAVTNVEFIAVRSVKKAA